MKKVLSMFLAALMILSCMSISAFADYLPFFDANDPTRPNPNTQVVFRFNLQGHGKCKEGQYVYDRETGRATWTAAEDVSDVSASTSSLIFNS